MSARGDSKRGGIVVDASAVVDLLLDGPRGVAVQTRLRGHALHAPAHLDAEVLSALGRLHRGGHVSTRAVSQRIRILAASPVRRHVLPQLMAGAWRRRSNLSLLDALYVELAERLHMPLVTTDRRLARASTAEYVEYVEAIGAARPREKSWDPLDPDR